MGKPHRQYKNTPCQQEDQQQVKINFWILYRHINQPSSKGECALAIFKKCSRLLHPSAKIRFAKWLLKP